MGALPARSQHGVFFAKTFINNIHDINRLFPEIIVNHNSSTVSRLFLPSGC